MGLDLRYIHDINQAKVVKTYIYVFLRIRFKENLGLQGYLNLMIYKVISV